MKNKKFTCVKGLFISILCCLYSLNTHSQANRCDGILIPDVRITNDERAWVRSTVNVFKSKHIETYDDYLSFASHATVPLEELPIPIDVSSSLTRENFKDFRDYLFKYDSTGERGNSKYSQTIRQLSAAVIKAWENCQAERGFRIWVIQDADPRVFTLAAIYNGPYNVHLSEVTFTPNSVTTVNHGKFTNKRLQTNTTYGWGNTVQYQTFRRTSDVPLTINVNPREKNAGEGLHIQLGSLKEETIVNKIEIANGALKEKSKLTVEWGIKDPDTEAAITNTWRNVPLRTSHYHEAAWANTFVEAKTLVNRDNFYSWQAEIINELGGKSGPAARGGWGEVEPLYRTTITLPHLKNDSQSFYSLIVKCGTYCREGDERAGIGSKGKLTITGKDLEKSFDFKVDHDFDYESLKLDSIKSGEYTLLMQMPKILHGSRGLHPNDPNAASTLIFETKISVQISAHEIAPKPHSESKSAYFIIGGMLLVGLISFVLLRRKKTT